VSLADGARVEASVLEGTTVTTRLVPVGTYTEFEKEHGDTLANVHRAGKEFALPWAVWKTMELRAGERRPFEEWVLAIETVGWDDVPSESDPSGGEENQTRESSPSSQSAPRARGTSSSASRTRSKKPSGTKSVAK
jgi:hypothetical protein